VKRRLVIVTEIIAPYRIPVFNALAARADIDLHVIFLAETDPGLRQWQVYKDEIRFSSEVLRSSRWRLGRAHLLWTRGTRTALERARPEVVVCGGYNYFAMWQAQRWARRRGVPFLLWSESNAADARSRLPWVESAKRRFVSACDGYVVPGRTAGDYLRTFGVETTKIFTAPNAVDVDRYARGAEAALGDPRARARLGLPARYLLFVGRFVRSKGVLDLLSAYATLPEETRQAVGLVLAGDGEERDALHRSARAIRPGEILFPGFLQRDELPGYYALADMLVFPTRSDPWGLVVNEAMACGLPVIVTEVAGCVADLVTEGENGLVVRPGDISGLSQAMMKLLSASEVRRTMSDRCRERSSRFTPEAWAAGVACAAGAMLGDRRG